MIYPANLTNSIQPNQHRLDFLELMGLPSLVKRFFFFSFFELYI